MSELNEVKILGTGTIAGGEYSEVTINGKAKANGNIKCIELKVNGSLDCKNGVECENDAKLKGILTLGESIKAKGLRAMGKLCIKGDITSEELEINGSLESKGKMRATKINSNGTLRCTSDIEAENINVSGTLACDGLVNAESLNLKMESKNMKIGSIGGGMITVYPGYTDNVIHKITPLKKVLKVLNNTCKLIVKESIEGDIVNLECVEAPVVCGRIVIIGEGCKIEKVQYSEKIEIAEGAVVENQIKI